MDEHNSDDDFDFSKKKSKRVKYDDSWIFDNEDDRIFNDDERIFNEFIKGTVMSM